MTLNELNKLADFNHGLIVYLDKKNKTFRFITDQEAEKFEKYTIRTQEDYKKLVKKYNIDINIKDFIKISNKVKKRNKNSEFKKVLAAMRRDIIKLSKKNN